MEQFVMTPAQAQIKGGKFFGSSGPTSPSATAKGFRDDPLGEDCVIHRSGAGVITNNYQKDLKRRLQREIDLKTKGWFSREQVPYQQLGDFSNIIQGIESVKNNLPHTKQNFDDQTLKHLKFIRKVQNPNQLKLEEPGRTVKILKQYQGQLNKIRASSQAEEEANFNNKYNHQRGQSDSAHGNKNGIFGDDTKEEEAKQRRLQVLRYQNAFINSPSMVKLITTSIDGRMVLKSEIADSNQRLLQIKHGMPINQVLYPPQPQLNDYKDSAFDISVVGGGTSDRLTENSASVIFKTSQIQKNQQKASNEESAFKIRKPKYQLSNVNGKYTVRSSLTQPMSPEKSLSPRVTIPLPNGGNTEFNPDGVIFIPNYHNNKHPKIIKMSNLAQVVPNKVDGSQASNSTHDVTTTNNSHRGQSVLDLINSTRKSLDRAGAVNSSMNVYSGDRPSGGGSSLSIWNQNAKKSHSKDAQNAHGMNYHKKLKDEFERFEKFIREQHIAEGFISAQHANTRQSHIRQMIANSFLNTSMKQTEEIDSLNSGRISGLSQELHAELSAIQVSRARQGNLPGLKNNTELAKESEGKKVGVRPMQHVSMIVNPGNKFKDVQIPQKHSVSTMAANAENLRSSLNHSQLQGIPNQAHTFKRHRLTRYERDQLLITAIINSIRGPASNEEEEELLLRKISEDYLWKECNTLLKDYFHVEFLNEIKDNKQLMFRLYKLYLLHQLLMRMKAIEENPNHPANRKRGHNRSQITNHSNSLLAPTPQHGEPPLYYEEYSDDEIDPNNPDPNGEEAEQRKYRGMDKDEIYKHKIKGFIHLLQDLLNPAEIPEARELDSVFQIKAQVRSYYERKGELSDNLTQTLYAMMQERTNIIESKKKYFFKSYESQSPPIKVDPSKLTEQGLPILDSSTQNMKKIKNLYFELEQMRVNSEKDRIKSYREMLEGLLTQASTSVIKKY